MSRRNTYLLGGLAVAAGVAMVVIAILALTSGDDESQPVSDRNAPERPIQPGSGGSSPAPPPPRDSGSGGGGDQSTGTEAEGAGVSRNLARNQLVKAPTFAAPLINDGSIPSQLSQAFERAAQGDALDLSKLRGTPVVLHLWSSRCAPCRADVRLVEATWKRWGPRGVLFVGMNVNEPGNAETVIRQLHLTYPDILDRNGDIATRYGATTLPHTYFISAGGDIVGEVAGSPSVRQLELGTAAARGGKAFGSEQGGTRVPLR